MAIGKGEEDGVVCGQGQTTVVIHSSLKCAIHVDELLTVNWVSGYVDVASGKFKVKVISGDIVELMLLIQRPVSERCRQTCEHVSEVMKSPCTVIEIYETSCVM